MKDLRVKGHDVYNLFSTDSEKCISLLISIHLGMTKDMELRISWDFLRTLDPGITINFKQDKWKDIHIYVYPSETVDFRGGASGKDPTCQ